MGELTVPPLIVPVFKKFVIVPELITPPPFNVPLLVKVPRTPVLLFWKAYEPVILPLFVTDVTLPAVARAVPPLVELTITPLLITELEELLTVNCPVSESVTPELITRGPVVQVTFEPSQLRVYGETEVEHGAAIT
ncbi:hypothetical protein G6709_00550 [Polynucleobacter paneuropaeus]|nr:hypothetical protein [Polynucleobacter paneuropaeus]